MSDNGPWTLDELAARVAAELSVDYPGAPSGRVRDVPDRRAIRWYTTIGLVDRPLGARGRTALYGPRHVLQLVAVKRRQAAGRTLAEIQAELAGAADRTLRDLAGAPAPELPDATDQPADQQADRPAGQPGTGERPARKRFWASPAASAAASAAAGPGTASAGVGPRSGAAGVGPTSGGAATVGRAVVLPGGVTVVLPGPGREPAEADLAAIGAAAGPLLEVLVRRGLVLVDDDGERSGGS